MTAAKHQRIRPQEPQEPRDFRHDPMFGRTPCGFVVVLTSGLVEVLKKKMSTTDALKLGIKYHQMATTLRIFHEPSHMCSSLIGCDEELLEAA